MYCCICFHFTVWSHSQTVIAWNFSVGTGTVSFDRSVSQFLRPGKQFVVPADNSQILKMNQEHLHTIICCPVSILSDPVMLASGFNNKQTTNNNKQTNTTNNNKHQKTKRNKTKTTATTNFYIYIYIKAEDTKWIVTAWSCQNFEDKSMEDVESSEFKAQSFDHQ